MITEKYIARQPIFNNKRNTVAYELLFREDGSNSFPVNVSATTATKNIIHHSSLEIGFDAIANGKKVLINIDEETLHSDIVYTLPVETVNLEILETVTPNEKNIERIKELKKYGFKIVLDDFILSPETKYFLPLTNLIKVDIRNRSWTQIKKDLFIYKKLGKKILAEKVETQNEFDTCKKLGFDFYQGYFFCRPKMLVKKCIKTQSHTVLSAYAALINEESYLDIANLISIDLGLSEKFLKYAFNIFRTKSKNGKNLERISSVYQALCLIGCEETRIFLRLAILEITEDQNSQEIIKMSFIRGRFLQSLYVNKGSEYKNRAHLVGFFSFLDVLLDTPMGTIVKQLNLHKDIDEAILYKKGRFGDGIKLIEAIENADFAEVRQLSKSFGIHLTTANTLYQKAIKWEYELSR